MEANDGVNPKTAEQMLHYIEAKWEYVEIAGPHDGWWWLILGTETLEFRKAAPNATSGPIAIAAAYDYTLAREEGIRLVEEEQAMLCSKILLEDKDMAAMKRVLAREQAALDELRKGLKP